MPVYEGQTEHREREGEAPAEPLCGQTRKHPQHGVVASTAKPTIVLLTVCTRRRAEWLSSHEVHRTLVQVWREASAWMVGRYVMMPDHIHLFAGACDSAISLESWVRYWKSQFSKEHKNRSHRWQTDHWDRRMRSVDQYLKKWEYVRQNPVRKGLVGAEHEWPYQGEIHRLAWDDPL